MACMALDGARVAGSHRHLQFSYVERRGAALDSKHIKKSIRSEPQFISMIPSRRDRLQLQHHFFSRPNE